MVRRAEQGRGVRDPHQPAEIHDRDTMRDMPDHRQIVRYEHLGQAETFLQILHQVDDLRLNRNIQRRNRFVRDDQPRLDRQSPRDGGALTLPAGKLERITPQMDRVQTAPASPVAPTLKRRR